MSLRYVHRILAGSLISIAGALAPATASAFNATLTIPNLCAGPIEVMLFSLEAMNTVVIGGGGGGSGAGKASIKPLVLIKAPDECTPLLFKAVFTGQHFQTATLQVGTAKAPLFTIQLQDVLITDLKHDFAKNGKGAGDDVLVESVTVIGESLTFTSGGTSVSCSVATNSCQ